MEHRNTCEDKYPWIKVGDTICLIHMEGEPDMPEGLMFVGQTAVPVR